MLPIIALIGRPNVGKSTLFNRLLRRSQAIAHDMPGVTRDRIFGEGQIRGVPFTLVDTGGMVMESEAVPAASKDFEDEIFEQAREAIHEADAILMVVDGREGLNPLDQQAAEFVRRANKPVLLLVNKVDGTENEAGAVADFHQLGFDMEPVSAAHGYNLNTVRDRVAALVLDVARDEEEESIERGLRIAMLGRPNAGKSSMVNALIGQNRLIVSDVAGTTRDSVDVTFDKDNKRYTFVDTAGVRRRANIQDQVERFSVFRALKNSKNADVTVMVVDVEDGFSRQDKRLLAYLVREKTPFILAVNKIDLVTKEELKELKKEYQMALRIASHVPVIYTSTVSKAGLGGLLPLCWRLKNECGTRVSTGQLNRVLRDVVEKHQPPVVRRKRPKFYYVTQTEVEPPTFVFFVNDPDILSTSYTRYLENRLRKMFNIGMAPMNIIYRRTHEQRYKGQPKHRGRGKKKVKK